MGNDKNVVEKFLTTYLEELVDADNSHNSTLAKSMTLISADAGRCVFEFDIKQEHTNSHGLLHRGITCAVGDLCSGSLSVGTAKPGMISFCLSMSMHIDFIGTAQLGEIIVCEGMALRAGKETGVGTSHIRRKSDNELIAVIRQTVALSKNTVNLQELKPVLDGYHNRNHS